ncbi:MAG: hypothetical protein Q9179_001343 [Wetmoreana sp. 5 TL-2023]
MKEIKVLSATSLLSTIGVTLPRTTLLKLPTPEQCRGSSAGDHISGVLDHVLNPTEDANGSQPPDEGGEYTFSHFLSLNSRSEDQGLDTIEYHPPNASSAVPIPEVDGQNFEDQSGLKDHR